ncbi:MAG: BON domain-containing protein [Thermoanaerobaculia bacterium]
MIHPLRAIPFLVVLVFSASLIAACSTTQSPSRQVNDDMIHTAVKAKLTGERFSNITNIDVNVTNGIVTLSGEVPNDQVKRDAENEARTVDGVRQVNNNLQVSNPPRP